MKKKTTRIQIGQSGIYEIQVQGLISQYWRGHFDGLTITVGGEDGWAITTLTGLVPDQAALQGLLQKLYSLGLVLLKVERKEN